MILINTVDSEAATIENSADPDQMALSVASRSGSTLFFLRKYNRIQQDKGQKAILQIQ